MTVDTSTIVPGKCLTISLTMVSMYSMCIVLLGTYRGCTFTTLWVCDAVVLWCCLCGFTLTKCLTNAAVTRTVRGRR